MAQKSAPFFLIWYNMSRDAPTLVGCEIQTIQTILLG